MVPSDNPPGQATRMSMGALCLLSFLRFPSIVKLSMEPTMAHLQIPGAFGVAASAE